MQHQQIVAALCSCVGLAHGTVTLVRQRQAATRLGTNKDQPKKQVEDPRAQAELDLPLRATVEEPRSLIEAESHGSRHLGWNITTVLVLIDEPSPVNIIYGGKVEGGCAAPWQNKPHHNN